MASSKPSTAMCRPPSAKPKATEPSEISKPSSTSSPVTSWPIHPLEIATSLFNAGLVPNVKENPRNRKAPKRGRKRLFNAAIHSLRLCVERTFAWEDKFKRLLLRFEFKQQRH